MALVDQLRDWDVVRTESVEAAMRAVPRHAFVPDASVERAYGFDPVVTHWNDEGVAISSASAPGVVAAMLDQLDVEPGHRVLEIGAGTGYNAALLAHLVGSAGAVTTVEYDDGVAQSARQALADAGYGDVTVICGDGEFGYADGAPYDRIVVTAGAWDVPPAWWEQLARGGRLLVPLRMRGLTRTVAFEREGGILRSRSIEECGFIPLRGVGEVAERNIRVGGGDGDLVVRIDDGRHVDAEALGRALDYSARVTWTGVNVPYGMYEHMDFWLVGMDGFCRVLASIDAVERGRLVAPAFGWGSMGVFNGGTLAYITMRAHDDTDDAEIPSSGLGVCAYGPDSAVLARQIVDRIRNWDREGGQRIELRIELHPMTAGDTPDARLVIDKKHTRIVVRTVRSGQ